MEYLITKGNNETRLKNASISLNDIKFSTFHCVLYEIMTHWCAWVYVLFKNNDILFH